MIKQATLGRWAMKYYYRHKEWSEALYRLKQVRAANVPDEPYAIIEARLREQSMKARQDLLKYCAQAAGYYPDEEE